MRALAVAVVNGIGRARLDEAWRVYQGLYLPSLARKTSEEYSSVMRRALVDLPDPLSVAGIVRWHRAELVPCYAPSYANFFLHVLRTVTRKSGLVTEDGGLSRLIAQVPLVREPVLPPRTPPRDLVKRSLELCRNPGERLFVQLASLAGLRRGEILGLRPGDYEPETHVLRVMRQRRSSERKNHRPHAVTLDCEAMRANLEWTMAHRDALASRSGWHKGKSDGYLYPWALPRVEGLLARFRAALGPAYLPPRCGWHLYRHWGASQLARQGKSVWEIMRWLGDADPTMATTYVSLHRDAPSSVGELSGL